MPAWFGPPRGTLPAALPSERVLASNARVAVCLSGMSVYPTGFEIDLLVLAAEDVGADMHDIFHRVRRRTESEEIPPDLLRFGVQFADGSKTTNLSGFHAGDGPPSGPVMVPRGGSGGGDSWRQTVWVWPLPPPGAVSVVVEWPAFDIPFTREQIDAQEILDAAARAQVLFPDEDLPEWQPDVKRGGPPSPSVG